MIRIAVVALAVLCLVTVAPTADGSGAESGMGTFDIRPFALPNTAPAEVWFEEPRDIVRLVVQFSDSVPDELAVSYQRKVWPETRLDELSRNHPGGFGWVPQDDWFNGRWQQAAVAVRALDQRRAEITFKGIKTELPSADLGDYDVNFRRTYAVKVDAKGNPTIQSVYTTSAPAHTDLRVELDAGAATPGGDAVGNEGYNAAVGVARQVAPTGTPRSFQLGVDHMNPAHAYSGDNGLVKFAFGKESFTISLVSLEQEGPIWYEDLGVFITKADDPTTFAQYRGHIKDLSTISQRVLARPEQSLAGAYNGQPRPHLDNFYLGCTGAAQRFRLEPNGDITLEDRNVRWLPSMHPERWKNQGHAGRFYLGLETWRITSRRPDPEPVMAYSIAAQKEGLSVQQQSFAVPLLTPILADNWQGGDPMVALVRFRFKNDGPSPVRAELPIRYTQQGARNGQGANQDDHQIPRGPLDTLSVQGGRILSTFNGQPCVRCALDTTMAVEPRGDTVLLTSQLQPGETCQAVVKIPHVVPQGNDELAALDGLSFDACYPQVTEYWRKVAGRGARAGAGAATGRAAHVSPGPRADGRLQDARRPDQHVGGYVHVWQLLQRVLHDRQRAGSARRARRRAKATGPVDQVPGHGAAAGQLHRLQGHVLRRRRF